MVRPTAELGCRESGLTTHNSHQIYPDITIDGAMPTRGEGTPERGQKSAIPARTGAQQHTAGHEC
jgi:hypothetical protein